MVLQAERWKPVFISSDTFYVSLHNFKNNLHTWLKIPCIYVDLSQKKKKKKTPNK